MDMDIDQFQTRKLLVVWLQLDIHSIMQLGFTRMVGESTFFSVILWSVKPICAFRLSIFENYQLTFVSGGISVRVAIICRLHPTKKAADFFNDFSEFVDSLATNSGHLLILSDFNIHWDC